MDPNYLPPSDDEVGSVEVVDALAAEIEVVDAAPPRQERIASLVLELLRELGEDPDREGLRETPLRVARAWSEWTSGYETDPGDVLKTFVDGAPPNTAGEMVIVSNIPVVSRCEHHLAEISGIAHVGYIPNGRVVGLSKLARVVDLFARRLQVQERLTNQVADSLVEHLRPSGVGVVIRATHGCMSTRGVRISGAVTTTSALRGAMLHNEAARAEFMALCRDAERKER